MVYAVLTEKWNILWALEVLRKTGEKKEREDRSNPDESQIEGMHLQCSSHQAPCDKLEKDSNCLHFSIVKVRINLKFEVFDFVSQKYLLVWYP